MLDISELVLGAVLGAVVSIIIKNYQEKIEWSDTRKATCDLIANDLSAIGSSAVDTFFQLIKESPKVSEFTKNLEETNPVPAGEIGKCRYSGNTLLFAIWYPAWMQFEVRHSDGPYSLSLLPYTKYFYENAFKNIEKARSDIRVLISIPGDMKVKIACVRFEQAATYLSWTVDKSMKQKKYPSIQSSLHFLYAAVELHEALNETTFKPEITDRLNTWWLTGK